ncbi:MAG: hypothetical protein AB1546_14060 [bacterium]
MKIKPAFIFFTLLLVLGLLSAGIFIIFQPSFRGKVKTDAVKKNNRKIENIQKEPDSKPEVNIRIKKPEISHWKAGKMKWVIHAEEVESDTGTGFTEFQGAAGEFSYDKRVLRFKAPKATFSEKTRTATVGDGITCSLAPQNYTITANRLTWDEKKGEITLGSDVNIKMDSSSVKAGRVVISGDLKTFHLSKGVEIEILIK